MTPIETLESETDDQECRCVTWADQQYIPCPDCDPELFEQWQKMQQLNRQNKQRSVTSETETKDFDEIPW
jgi:hypothetical protein